MKKKILYVVKSLNLGGIENLLLETILGLNEKANLEFHVLVFSKKGGDLYRYYKDAVNEVVFIPFSHTYHFWNFFRIYKYIKSHGFDILHTHVPIFELYPIIIGKLTGVPLIITSVHFDKFYNVKSIKKMVLKIIEKLIFKLTDRYHTVSNYIKARIFSELKLLPDKKVKVIHNSVSLKRLELFPHLKNKNLDFIKNGERLVITNIANFFKYKGHLILVKAAYEITKQTDEVVFVLIGTGPEKDRIIKKVKELNLENYFFFTGKIMNIGKILEQTDIYIQTSLTESFGISLLEAMAYKIPPVASDIGGIPEIITDGQNGFLFPTGDHKKLSEKVLRLVNDRSLLKSMGASAYKTYIEKFNFEKYIEKIIQIYAL